MEKLIKKLKKSLFEMGLEDDLEVKSFQKESLMNFIIGMSFLYDDLDDTKFLIPVIDKILREDNCCLSITLRSKDCEDSITFNKIDVSETLFNNKHDESDFYWNFTNHDDSGFFNFGITVNDVAVEIFGFDKYTHALVEAYGKGIALIKEMVLNVYLNDIFNAYNELSKQKMDLESFSSLFREVLRESETCIYCA